MLLHLSAWASVEETELFDVFRLSAEARAGKPICAHFSVFVLLRPIMAVVTWIPNLARQK